jgi:hypothetical protein
MRGKFDFLPKSSVMKIIESSRKPAMQEKAQAQQFIKKYLRS